jgi:hypothetical protein
MTDPYAVMRPSPVRFVFTPRFSHRLKAVALRAMFGASDARLRMPRKVIELGEDDALIGERDEKQ